jgi:cytidylate kinase
MDEKFIITIGRQLGSGGRQIGMKLAERLGIPFYDKELLYIASRESGLDKGFFEKFDEKSTHGLWGSMLGFNELYFDASANYLNNETIFSIQSDVIRDLGNKGSSIFVGRCADAIFKENPRCLNIFITAELSDRIKRLTEAEHISENKALSLIEKTDKQRASYYNYYSNKTWGAAASYHLCINSSLLGIDKTVSLIHRFIVERLGL